MSARSQLLKNTVDAAGDGVVDVHIQARALVALRYTNLFDFPLSTAEVWLRLPGLNSGEGKTVAPRNVAQALISLWQLGLVVYEGGFWRVTTVDSRAFVETRKKRAGYTKGKLAEIDGLVSFLRLLPGIKGVAITGSVSMHNATENDDIDFMMVTNPGRLWLVRPIVTAFAWLKGKRRSWQKEEENSWCFNLWLDANQLQLPVKKRNVYTAHEVCQVQWVVEKGSVARDFFMMNKWAQFFLPHLYWQNVSACKRAKQHWQLPGIVFSLFGAVLNFLNWGAYRMQLWYMRAHRTTEKVGFGYAFFHPRDTYGQIKKNL